mmetsp:Transcript_9580/g.28606  ORF Transcript_9580/g.28606 Transcript_9580/m.28606 type:complete len:83 (-) Transcript_9580:110-358(-)
MTCRSLTWDFQLHLLESLTKGNMRDPLEKETSDTQNYTFPTATTPWFPNELVPLLSVWFRSFAVNNSLISALGLFSFSSNNH